MAENEEILQKVWGAILEFYTNNEGESMEQSFNAFASDYAHIFDDDFDDEDKEQKLEYMDVYKKYQDLFEKMLESLIAKCEISQEDFAAAMSAKPAEGEEENIEK